MQVAEARRRGRSDREANSVGAGTSLYEEVTRRVIAQLEAGCVPWVRPWTTAGCAAALPVNAVSGRPYSGVNVLLLWSAAVERGYGAQRWLTFRQAHAAGGAVLKGERGTMVVYADRFTPERAKARTPADDGEAKTVPFLKRFILFNVAQCDGLPAKFAEVPPPLPPEAVLPEAQALIAASGAVIRIGGECACYVPATDVVRMPPPPAFAEPLDYYRTLFHELGHWTGHASRLARDLSGTFGAASYAREELIAEMTAAFVSAALGIAPTLRHADYIAHWLAVLRGDARAIFRAASAAARASDFLRRVPAFQAELPPCGG